MYIDTLLDSAAPSAELGASFSANVGPNVLPPKGAFLKEFVMSIFGDVATAPVVIETVTAAMSQFTFKAGQETRIQLGLRDLIAVMAVYYKQLPKLWENTDNTGTSYILGVRIPVNETIAQGTTYTWAANYAAQTNFSAVFLTLQAVYNNNANGRKPLILVPISYTTPGATGMSAVNARLQNLGDLLGLLVFNTTLLSDGLDVMEIQRIQLVESGKQTSLLNAANGSNIFGQWDYEALGAIGETLNNYWYYDFSDEPLNVSDGYVEFIADIEATSGVTRIIPIIQKKS